MLNDTKIRDSKMLKILYRAILTFFLVVFGLNASGLASSNVNQMDDMEEIHFNDRFVDLEKGFSKKSIDNKYTAIVTKFNERGHTKFEPGIITVRNENTGEEQIVETKSGHEAINDLIWTKHDILLIILRASSTNMIICSYDPEKDKKVFESYYNGDGISISPDHLKIAFLRSVPKIMPVPHDNDTVMISFDIRNQEPQEMHPSKEYDNQKHLYYRTLKWNNDSNKLALIEELDDYCSALTIWHFDGGSASKEEVINDVEMNQYFPRSITNFDSNNISINYLEFVEKRGQTRVNTDKKEQTMMIPLK